MKSFNKIIGVFSGLGFALPTIFLFVLNWAEIDLVNYTFWELSKDLFVDDYRYYLLVIGITGGLVSLTSFFTNHKKNLRRIYTITAAGLIAFSSITLYYYSDKKDIFGDTYEMGIAFVLSMIFLTCGLVSSLLYLFVADSE